MTQRKKEIYIQAANLFKEKGYPAASMRDLADRVGIEASSLYSHIKSKEQILIEICQSCGDLFNKGIDEILNVEDSLKFKLFRIIDLHLNIAQNRPSSIVVFTDEWKHLPESALLDFRQSRKSYENKFEQLIKLGQESGVFKKEMKAKLIVNMIISSLKWTLNKKETLNSDKTRDEIKLFIHNAVIT